MSVILPSHDEHYVYEQAHTTVHNIVVGSLWLDNAGTITIREVNGGELTVSLRFKRYSCLFGEAKVLGDVDGKVVHTPKRGANGGGSKRSSRTLKLSGNWTKSLVCDGEELWRVTPRPPATETAGHNMTAWGWSLNAPPTAASAGGLPRTDSRLRPDQRALENGDFQLATAEKHRVEQAQRAAREARKERGETYAPRWFERRSGVDGRKVSELSSPAVECLHP
jgi:hypothetical protein